MPKQVPRYAEIHIVEVEPHFVVRFLVERGFLRHDDADDVTGRLITMATGEGSDIEPVQFQQDFLSENVLLTVDGGEEPAAHLRRIDPDAQREVTLSCAGSEMANAGLLLVYGEGYRDARISQSWEWCAAIVDSFNLFVPAEWQVKQDSRIVHLPDGRPAMVVRNDLPLAIIVVLAPEAL